MIFSLRSAVAVRLLVAALAVAACREPATEPTATGPATKNPAGAAPPAKPREDAPRVHVRAEGQLGPGGGVLLIDLAPPDGAKLTLDAPLSVGASGGIGLAFPTKLGGALSEHRLPLRLPIEVEDGATGPALVDLSYYWCTEGDEAACRREQSRLSVELDLSGSGAGGEAHLSYRALGDKS